MFVFCLAQVANPILLKVVACPWELIACCGHHLFARNRKLLDFLPAILIIIKNKPATIGSTRFELLAQIIVLLAFLLGPCVSWNQSTPTEAEVCTERVTSWLAAIIVAQSLSVVVPHGALGIIILAFIRKLLIGGLCLINSLHLALKGQIFNIRINLLKFRDLIIFI